MTMVLVGMRLAASLLLTLVVGPCTSSSSPIYHDYIVVGAGPSGLQFGYFLERAGRDYVILERGSQTGAFGNVQGRIKGALRMSPLRGRKRRNICNNI